MRTSFFTRSRKWLGASALAIIIGLGGGSAFLAATSSQVTAQATVTQAAQITAPPAVAGSPGFADLVQAVSPAVVSIIVESDEPAGNFQRGGDQFQFNFPDLPENSPFRDFFEQFGDQFGNGQGQGQREMPRHMMAAGSGFVISPDGYLVTNNHVVESATKVTVVFEDGNEMDGKVIGTDPRTDLAVVKVDGSNLPYVQFSEDEARVGDWVVAVGNPFGLGGTVTAGIVSARGRDIGGSNQGDFLQIDAAVNTGNSGGPAFNLEGKVIGVNTAIYSPNGGSVGIAFAIPSSTVESIVQQLRDSGKVERGFLGVSIQDINRDLADSLGLDKTLGALVTQPTDDGPAAKAGIKSGDVIVEVDGDPISNALDLSRTIAAKGPNAKVDLKVWSDGASKDVTVTLDPLDESAQVAAVTPQTPVEPAVPAESSVGLTLVPNANGPGVLIQEVNPDGIAADKGFAVGDTILQVDNKDIASAQDFEAAIAGVKSTGSSTALIKAERDGNVRFLGLPLGEEG